MWSAPESPYIESPAKDDSSLENGINLRILPLGDSITWGYGSTDGNGYRLDLLNLLAGNDVQYIVGLGDESLPILFNLMEILCLGERMFHRSRDILKMKLIADSLFT